MPYTAAKSHFPFRSPSVSASLVAVHCWHSFLHRCLPLVQWCSFRDCFKLAPLKRARLYKLHLYRTAAGNCSSICSFQHPMLQMLFSCICSCDFLQGTELWSCVNTALWPTFEIIAHWVPNVGENWFWLENKMGSPVSWVVIRCQAEMTFSYSCSDQSGLCWDNDRTLLWAAERLWCEDTRKHYSTAVVFLSLHKLKVFSRTNNQSWRGAAQWQPKHVFGW